MPLEMRIGLGQFDELTDEKLAYIKQLGSNDFLMNTPKLPGEVRWEFEDLRDLKQRADHADLRLMALENVPIPLYYVAAPQPRALIMKPTRMRR